MRLRRESGGTIRNGNKKRRVGRIDLLHGSQTWEADLQRGRHTEHRRVGKSTHRTSEVFVFSFEVYTTCPSYMSSACCACVFVRPVRYTTRLVTAGAAYPRLLSDPMTLRTCWHNSSQSHGCTGRSRGGGACADGPGAAGELLGNPPKRVFEGVTWGAMLGDPWACAEERKGECISL